MPLKRSLLEDSVVNHIAQFEGDGRGVLSVIEGPYMRAFWLTHVPYFAERGDHAVRRTTQTFICIQGTARLTVEDMEGEEYIALNDPQLAVQVPPLVWRKIHRCSADAVILVLCDRIYDADEYMKDKKAWKQYLQDHAAQADLPKLVVESTSEQ